MEVNEISASLREAAAKLTSDELAALDFEQLQQLLVDAAGRVESLQAKTDEGQRLAGLLRDELANRARAIARAQGRETHLALQILAQPSLQLSELLDLRRELSQEFDRVFSAKLTAPPEAAAMTEELQQFKI